MRELEARCEGLEKIRKDIMSTVGMGEEPGRQDMPYSGPRGAATSQTLTLGGADSH